MGRVKDIVIGECDRIANETKLPWDFVMDIFNKFTPLTYFTWKELALCEAKYSGMI